MGTRQAAQKLSLSVLSLMVTCTGGCASPEQLKALLESNRDSSTEGQTNQNPLEKQSGSPAQSPSANVSEPNNNNDNSANANPVDKVSENAGTVDRIPDNAGTGSEQGEAANNSPNAEFSITEAINWAKLDPSQKQYSRMRVDRNHPKGAAVLVTTSNPGFHLSRIRMQTTPQRMREEIKNSGKPVFVHFELNVGIFTRWNFVGSLGEDSLKFGSQGHIITKQTGGIVDFKADSARDVFEFTNTINVQKCSEKHGFQCHPLNHLQQVTIKNFGKEDLIILQGKRYRYSDVRNDGTLPNVPASRLKVEKM